MLDAFQMSTYDAGPAFNSRGLLGCTDTLTKEAAKTKMILCLVKGLVCSANVLSEHQE